jgi:sugar lactone lactonase YvrE
MTPERVVNCRCRTGENPLWHPTEKRLYWTDIPSGRLYRYDPASGKHEIFHRGDVVGGFTIQTDGTLLLFMAKGAIAVLRRGHLEYIVREMPGQRQARFNDVIADPAGRVFCGTMHDASGKSGRKPGRLYRLDLDGHVTQLLDGIGVSNGLAFSHDRKHMFYTDSPARKIYRFDYDEATGNISNHQVFIEVPLGEGDPDGMTIDAEGHIWSARWDGSALYRYAPSGAVERRIDFPAKKVSSLTFGGDRYADMYVTTALGSGTRDTEGPGAGALFRLRLGIRGVPEYYSRVGMSR